MEPTNYAAFMDEYWHGRTNNPADIGNSTFFNFCGINLNSNPLNASDNLSYLHQMQLIQLWKQQVELMDAFNQLVISTRNASAANSTVLDNSNTVSPTRSPTAGANPFVEKTPKNPFQTDQEEIVPETSNITNSLDGSIDSLGNPTLNDSVRLNGLNSTTLPNVSSRESTLGGCKENNVFSTKPTEGFGIDKNQSHTSENCESIDMRLYNKAQFEVSQKNVGGKMINDKEFIVNDMPDTNPFKQDVVPGFNSKGIASKEQRSADFRPPIPPRNLNHINKAGNVPAKNVTDATCTTLPVFNNLQNTPTTKIYYKADPVIYDSRNSKTKKTSSTSNSRTTKLTDSVSFRNSDSYNVVNSLEDLTYHSLSPNTLPGFDQSNSSEGHSKSLQSELGSRLSTTHTNNIFTETKKFPTNYMYSLGPSFSPSSYRPPPPPYNENNSAQYSCKGMFPITPRFISPTVPESSKAAVDGINDNFFDKFESLVTKKSSQNSCACEKQSSSSFITTNNIIPATTTSAQASYCQNSVKSSTPYKINLIIPKFLQGQQRAVSSEQELPDTLIQTIKQEPCSPTSEGKSTTQWSVGDQATCDFNDASTTNPKEPGSWRNTFETVIDNPTASLPALHSQQNLVNEQQSLTKDSSLTPNGEVVGDKESLRFPNTQSRNRPPYNTSYPHQPPPSLMNQNYTPLYPNLAHMQHPTYSYQMPQSGMMQHQPVDPRAQLFGPSGPGFYPSAPHWPRPQSLNPGFSYVHQQPHPWNPYNVHAFAHPRTPYTYRAPVPTPQKTCETDFNKESVSSGLNHAQKVGQEDEEVVNTVPKEEMLTGVSHPVNHITDQSTASELTDPLSSRVPQELTNSHCNAKCTANLKDGNSPTQLREPNTRTYQNVPNNGTEKLREGSNSKQVLNKTERDCSGKSLNGYAEDIPQYSSPRAATHVFKTVEVNKQTIYLFNIQNEGWVCTDEIALTFTPYENHDTIVRCLEIAGVQIKFKEVSRAQSPLLFTELDGTTVRLPRMKNSKRIKGTLHLTPMNSLIAMMYHLRLISADEVHSMQLRKQLPPSSKLPALLELMRAYRSNDEYWVS